MREITVRQNLDLRKKFEKRHALMKHYVPLDFNTEADNIEELSDMKKAVAENPITMNQSKEALLNIMTKMLDLPCHTQDIERNVKLMTEVAAKLVGDDEQYGYAFNVVDDRKDTPSCESKRSLVFQSLIVFAVCLNKS